MRQGRLLVVGLVGALLATFGTPVAEGSVADDWAVVEFTAGPGGTDGTRLEVDGRFEGTGDGPLVLGFGSGGDGRYPYVDLLPTGGGPAAVTTSHDVGGLDVEVIRSGDASASFRSVRHLDGVAEGQRIVVLLFAGNAELRDLSAVQVGPLDGSVEPGTVSIHRGSGTEVVYSVSPDDEGPAVSAGAAAAGTRGHAGTLDEGIVGALNVWQCDGCVMDWSGPDGRSGSAVRVVGYTTVSGSSWFGGPAGDWSWSWTGVDGPGSFTALARPVVAAYAPVGAFWGHFDPFVEPGSSPPVGGQPPGNDDRQDAVTFDELSFEASQRTVGATVEPDEPAPCGRIGSTVWYAYEPSSAGGVVVDTHGSGFDTVLAVYEGGSLLGCNDDGDGTASDLEFSAEAGRTYLIQVGGHEGDAGALELHASVASEGPPAPEWGEPGDEPIRPGIPLLIGDGAGCTANFVFRGTGSRAGTLYLGTAAHCVDDDIGAPVYHAETGEQFGRVAYSSFKELGIESYPCPVIVSCSDDNNNDFALIEIDEGHRDDVHPAMLHYGGPTGMFPYEDIEVGDKVLSYGNSSLRPGPGQEDRLEGYVTGKEDPSTILVHTFPPAIFGDSGSGVLMASGEAVGVLVTGLHPMPPMANGLSALSSALDFAATVGWDVELQTSELLNPGLLPALSG